MRSRRLVNKLGMQSINTSQHIDHILLLNLAPNREWFLQYAVLYLKDMNLCCNKGYEEWKIRKLLKRIKGSSVLKQNDLEKYVMQFSRAPMNKGTWMVHFLGFKTPKGTEQDGEGWRISLLGWGKKIITLLQGMPLIVLLPWGWKLAKCFEKHNIWYEWNNCLLACWIDLGDKLLTVSWKD